MIVNTINKYIDSSFTKDLWYIILSYVDKDVRHKFDDLLQIG